MKNSLKSIIAVLSVVLIGSTAVAPITNAQVYTEPPMYTELYELINEFGEKVYVKKDDVETYERERARIEQAIAEMNKEKEGNESKETGDSKGNEENSDKGSSNKSEGNTSSSGSKGENNSGKTDGPSSKTDLSKGTNNKDTNNKDTNNKGTNNKDTNSKKTSSKGKATKKQGNNKPKVSYKIKSVTKDETQKFIDSVAHDIKEVADANELYASVMIAQTILATNSGTTYLASENMNNLMGLKGSFKGNSVLLNSPEGFQHYRKYSSVKEGFEDYVKLMNKDIYVASLKSTSETSDKAVDTIAKHYAVDPEYGNKLKSLIENYNLKKFDK